MSRIHALAMAVVLSIALAAGPARADTVACGDVLTAGVTLSADLNCAGDGLTVDADGVTVDLAGHTITGAGTGVGIRVSNHTGVVVKDGAITGFTRGVDAFSATVDLVDAKAAAVRGSWSNLHVSGTPANCVIDGLFAKDGDELTVDHCVVHGTVSVFSMHGGALRIKDSKLAGGSLDIFQSDNGVYSGNVFDDFPVSLGFECRHSIFRYNLFKNAATALDVDAMTTPANAGTVERNVFLGNDIGLRARQHFRNVVVRNNVFNGNRTVGMLVENSLAIASPDPVAGNVFTFNGRSPSGIIDGAGNVVRGGLHLRSVTTPPGQITLKGNVGHGNDGPLIWAPPGQVTDGGGNQGPCEPTPNPDLTCF
ncbi:right-handed parallel beta-helix repeat-containing protein [Nonomuraea sp. NPDC049695]|uniref:right-handed parallel beta-helix repeat-containing protein n=1 Tax=Nonomuraea sp. NPDC049695 TaxID=3154734 RepID=UPI0034316ECC